VADLSDTPCIHTIYAGRTEIMKEIVGKKLGL
jgi:hypothetical protein